MNRWTAILVAAVILTMLGCSNNGGNPTTPGTDLTNGVQSSAAVPQTHLWGYYDVYIDIENQTATAVMNRDVMFAANVTTFVNKPASNLAFKINETPATADYIDVDIDVSIKHPFTGLSQYNGYDVRGVFIGGSSKTMKYNTDLKYGAAGTNQIMLDDPTFSGSDSAGGGPDGYTRWFNPVEFTTPGLGGYTPGVFASAGYTGTATLAPFKYFADGLGKNASQWDFLNSTSGHGVFSAGTTNTRNYYLRFPTSVGVKYGYAIVANWKNETTHPSNAPEAVGLKTVVEPNIYYAGPTSKGGNLIFDASVFGWQYQPSAIYVESSVLSASHKFTPSEMTPIGGDSKYSTYHCDIVANNITGATGNDFWVVCEYDSFNYVSGIGVPNTAGTDKLAAIFRYDLAVSTTPLNAAPVVDSGVTGEEEPFIANTETYTVTAHDDDADPLTYAWTVTDNGSSTELLSDDPGNGDGTIDINWASLGIVDAGSYDIDCTVSDGTAAPVPATTLTVTGSAVLYLYDGTVDDGGMTTTGEAYGPNKWQYLSGEQLWDENGNTSYEDNDMCTSLATPQINIPSGATNVFIEITHSGNIWNYYGSYAGGSGMVGYTTDNGSSINWNQTPCNYSDPWLGFDSGTDFNFPSYYYGNLGFYSVYYMGCDPWGYWVGYAFCDKWGSVGDPITSTWNCNALIGKSDVQFCFNYNSMPSWLTSMQGNGWQINKVKVYVAP